MVFTQLQFILIQCWALACIQGGQTPMGEHERRQARQIGTPGLEVDGLFRMCAHGPGASVELEMHTTVPPVVQRLGWIPRTRVLPPQPEVRVRGVRSGATSWSVCRWLWRVWSAGDAQTVTPVSPVSLER